MYTDMFKDMFHDEQGNRYSIWQIIKFIVFAHCFSLIKYTVDKRKQFNTEESVWLIF